MSKPLHELDAVTVNVSEQHLVGSSDHAVPLTGSKDKRSAVAPPVVAKGQGVKSKALAIDEHKLSLEELCARYRVTVDMIKPANSQGLSDADAKARVDEYGPNTLSPPKKKNPILKYLECLSAFFNLLLLAASILTFILYGMDDQKSFVLLTMGIILILVAFLNAFIEFFQIQKSAKTLESFLNMIPSKCNAVRDRHLRNMSAIELVPGDVAFVRMGDKVPADLLLFHCSDMKVDNSSLTGESEPQDRVSHNTNASVLEATNIAFNGTLVINGEGYGIVIRTGDNTVIGQIADMAAGETKRPSPLSHEIDNFVRIIGTIAISTALIFFLVALLQPGGNIKVAFNFAVGILTAWVPQGLPSTVTMLLTIAAKRMSKQNVLVKDLHGVESLGAITMLCTDKTGTLTRNQMTVSNLWTQTKLFSVVTDQRSLADKELPFDSAVVGIQEILLISAVCSRARFNTTDIPIEQREIVGDATETGLFRIAHQKLKNFDKLAEMYPKVFEIPFNSETKWHMSIHQLKNTKGPLTMFIKGAPERVLRVCSQIMGIDGQAVTLTEEHRTQFTESYEYMAGKGHRVLAFAKLELPGEQFPADFVFTKEDRNYPTDNMTFVGLASLEDPPKHGVREAIGHCRRAGVKVVMVTGDHPLTAEAVARKINLMLHDTKEKLVAKLNKDINEIDEDEVKAIVIHGEQIESLNNDDWDLIFSKEEIIFARTSPKHKLQIVKYAQSLGHIVGVTGDGVNDSPALKKADLGIAMNLSGSDVSKEAASMILLDDNFASTVNGIREGRLIFMNLKKSIQYVLTHSIPEVIPQLVYVLTPMPLAINALQILVVDLGFELMAALSYAYEPPESDTLMKLPPRKPVSNESIRHLRERNEFDARFRKVDVETADVDRPLTIKETFISLFTLEYWRRFVFGPSYGEVVVDGTLLSWAYLEAGIIQTAGCFAAFIAVVWAFVNADGVHLKLSMNDIYRCNLRKEDSSDPNLGGGFQGFSGDEGKYICTFDQTRRLTVPDQHRLLAQAQSIFYASIMICQMWNLIACKCRLRSPFTFHVLKNKTTWASIAAGLIFCAFIIYTPGVDKLFNTDGGFNPVYYLISFGFGFFVYLYAGFRFWIQQKLRPVRFAPEPIGLQMHPTRWSRSSRH